ncbi:hypothetical protein IIC65_06430 [Candidatus Sumerlaeota bacterium]|nr:hypothetical protein [Candidatus Sumerlaeota bacterium]
MLRRVDRIQMAVPERDALIQTLGTLFGATASEEDVVECWAARRTRVRLGASWVEVLEPSGPGPVQEFVDRWRGGLFAAGFETGRLDEVCASIGEAGLTLHREGGQVFVEPGPIGGLRAVISPAPETQPEPAGLLRRLYEVTNPVADLDAVTQLYVRAFGLDRSRWRPISSELYGYTGALTLFEPPEWLDRIEVTQITDYSQAMGRFHKKRGDSLYMCFAEVEDFGSLKDRLDAAGARFAVRQREDGAPNVLFVHPSSLHGMLMGVSRTGVAWDWSSGGGEPWA